MASLEASGCGSAIPAVERSWPPDQRTHRDEGGGAVEIIDRVSRLNISGRDGMSNLASQWISILEAGTAATTLPVRQMQAFVGMLRAQRDQIRALQSQLDAFDEGPPWRCRFIRQAVPSR